MNTFSKTIMGLMMISLVIITLIMYNILETIRENNPLYTQSQLTWPSPAATPVRPGVTAEKKPSPNDLTLCGIDVSHWDGTVTEDLLSNDQISFVICKSTEGTHGTDPDFRNNWNFLTENHITKGAYHLYVYSESPVQQALHFSNTVGEVNHPDFPLIIDIEEASLPKKYIDQRRLKEDVLKFLEYIEQKTKRTPMIYSNYAFIDTYLDDKIFSKYPLRLAEYSHAPKPLIPKAWKKKGCLIWQKTDRYDISSKELDLDVYYP